MAQMLAYVFLGAFGFFLCGFSLHGFWIISVRPSVDKDFDPPRIHVLLWRLFSFSMREIGVWQALGQRLSAVYSFTLLLGVMLVMFCIM